MSLFRQPGTDRRDRVDTVIEDFERCYRAMQSKDARFDGWFFVAVKTTGIYCRPSCPARTPNAANVCFMPSAAAAQRAGYRACKRCRPDASPGSPEWNTRSDVLARAMRLLADGVVDRKGVPALASEIGYSVRQLERLFVQELGAGPAAIAAARRAETARILVDSTDLALSDVAFSAGFSSVRQFNDTFKAVYSMAPSALRRSRALSAAARVEPATRAVSLRLPFRSPFEPHSVFAHLAATAIPGCEELKGTTYRRTMALPHAPAVIELSPTPGWIQAKLWLHDWRDLSTAVARCRRLLDLDADPVAIAPALSDDDALGALVKAHPGRRLPGCPDPAEMTIRAVLGQQVSTKAAGTIGARLVQVRGEPLEDPTGGGLNRLFPSPEALVDPPALGMPSRRQRTLAATCQALTNGGLQLGIGACREDARRQLLAIDGIGAWTAEIVALRGLGDPDAMPVGDVGVRRAASSVGLPGAPGELTKRAERWRPWRSYAVAYLWATIDHPDQPAATAVSYRGRRS